MQQPQATEFIGRSHVAVEPQRVDVGAPPDALPALVGDWRRQFGGIVTRAHTTQRTRFCALAILDRGTLSYRVCRGFSPADWAPELDDALEALRSPQGILVPDASRIRSLSALDHVRDGSVRFYASHPIGGPNGEPVAVLSVFDPAPRPPSSRDIVLLRRSAAAAQQRLNLLIEKCSRPPEPRGCRNGHA